MRWILALSLLVGGIVAAGCSTDHERRDGGIPMSASGEAIDEKYPQSDPVCGMRVNPRSAITEDYGGQTWYFDNDECRRKFHDNPTAYVPVDHRDQTATASNLDPVCGMNVDPRTAAFKEEYGGKTFYFDSKDCWQKFHDNPHAYLPGGDDRNLKPQREVK